MENSLRKLLALVAFAGFGASFVVHASTFWGVNPGKVFPGVFLLHLGLFLLCLPMLVEVETSPVPQEPEETKASEAKTPTQIVQEQRQKKWDQAFVSAPQWAQSLLALCMLYAIINFAAFFFTSVLMDHGGPEIVQGQYVIRNHGQIVRPLTASEYEAKITANFKAFSGHWMFFYLAPAVYFWFSKVKADGEKEN